jgi:copper(I)-binding protein
MTTEPPPSATEPAEPAQEPVARPVPPPRTDIYFRIRRFAPILVVLFCAGILVVMAVVRPFTSPPSAPELQSPLVGAGLDPAAAYVVIHNTGGNDTLIGASTPAAGSVELQQREGQTESDPGVLVTVDQIEVPGYEDTRLQPGADQLLLVDLARPLSPGDTVQLTLEFERAGSVTVDAEVASYLDIADRLLPPRLVIPGQDGNPAQPGQVGGQ